VTLGYRRGKPFTKKKKETKLKGPPRRRGAKKKCRGKKTGMVESEGERGEN